jgi:hypothetical protein
LNLVAYSPKSKTDNVENYSGHRELPRCAQSRFCPGC